MADWNNQGLTFRYYFPTSTTAYGSTNAFNADGSQNSFATDFNYSVHAFIPGVEEIDISFPGSSTFYNTARNGFTISGPVGDIPIKSIYLASSNMVGLSASNLSYTANSVSVNWPGLAFVVGVTTVAIDVVFDAPAFAPVAVAPLEQGQQIVIGTAIPGLPGDTLTFVGSSTLGGTLALGAVQADGTQPILYTAPSVVTASATDTVSYTFTDEYGTPETIQFFPVQLDGGATIAAATAAVVEKGQATVVGTVTPGLAGDALTLSQAVGALGALSLGAVQADGTQQVVYTAPGSVAASTIDKVGYTVSDQHGDVVASASSAVQLDAGATIASATAAAVEKSQSTVVGTVTPGLAGDALTLTQAAGTLGTLSLGATQADGTQQVIYTAPGSVAASTLDKVGYTVVDQHGDVVASASSAVQLDAGATIAAATPTVVEKGQATVVGTVTPGFTGDALTLTQAAGALGALSLGPVQANGTQQVIYTAPASVAASTLDKVVYTVADQHGGVVATASLAVQIDAGATIASATPGIVEKNQTTVIGTVTPGLTGDVFTLTQAAGAVGTLSLGAVQANGSQQVVYTAPNSISASTLDKVGYTVTDQHNDVVASASSSVQLDAGATIAAATPGVVEKGQGTVVGTVTPGLAGDVLMLTQVAGAVGTLNLGAVQANGSQQVIYTAPGSIPASALDKVAYIVIDQHNAVVASASSAVQLDAGATIAAATPTAVEKGQTIVIGTVTPGVAGDALTLSKTAGVGALSLGTVQANGTQQVIYTAPGSVAASTIDKISYTIADQHGGVVASASSAVQLDAGATIVAATPMVVEKGQATVVGMVAPGLAGDVLTLTQTAGAAGALALGAVQANGTQQVVYTASGSIAASALDKVGYTIVDQHNAVVASASSTVQLDAGATIAVVAPAVVEKTQTTVVGIVTPGLAGDVLTLSQTPGAIGTLSLGAAQTNGTQQVIYTAPGSVAASALDKVAYTVVDQHNAVVASASSAVQLDAGPKAGSVATTVLYGGSVDLANLILGAATPGSKGDTLRITGDTTTGTLGSLSLVNGALVYSTNAPGLSHIPANGSQADAFGYTLTDPYGGTVTGSVQVSVTNPATTINGSPYGFSTLQGTKGANIINAFAYFNTITDIGGNDVVNAGLGNATVSNGSGDVVTYLQGYFDTVTGGNGNDTVAGSAGNATVSLGNGTDTVLAGGYNNRISLGSGNDTVNAGLGNAQVALGGGNDVVTLGGYGNTVAAGNGNVTVKGGQGLDTVTLGSGNDSVTENGFSNLIKVGSGTDTIVAGSGLDTVVAGAGTDTITLAGNNNAVILNGGKATVSGGQGGDSITATGGSESLTFAGWNSTATLNGSTVASIADLGKALRINVASSTQTDTITGFGSSDGAGVVNLLNGAGGFASVSQVVAALHNDGHGGTMLSLGASGSVDFANTAASQLHASNFKVG